MLWRGVAGLVGGRMARRDSMFEVKRKGTICMGIRQCLRQFLGSWRRKWIGNWKK